MSLNLSLRLRHFPALPLAWWPWIHAGIIDETFQTPVSRHTYQGRQGLMDPCQQSRAEVHGILPLSTPLLVTIGQIHHTRDSCAYDPGVRLARLIGDAKRGGEEKEKKKRKHENAYANNRCHTNPAIKINSEPVSYLMLPPPEFQLTNTGLDRILLSRVGSEGKGWYVPVYTCFLAVCGSDWAELSGGGRDTYGTMRQSHNLSLDTELTGAKPGGGFGKQSHY